MLLFWEFARSLHHFTLAQFYTIEPLFNHTPATALFLRFLFAISGSGTSTERLANFAFYLRAFCAAADVGTVLLLWQLSRFRQKPQAGALTAFALSPVSLMISGFHGNIDPIMTLGLVASAVAAVNRKPALSGLFFGLACNVKIVPLPLLPVFFFQEWPRQGAWRFLGATIGMLALGFGFELLSAPGALLHNVFGYSSSFGGWGITFWIKKTGWASVQNFAYQGLTPTQTAIASALKLAIVAGIIAFAWKRRSQSGTDLFSVMAAAWAVFFVFAPGIGGQYMVWCAPFFLVYSVRWWAAITTGATIMLAVYYASVSGNHFPWLLAKARSPETPLVDPWSVCLWLLFVIFLALEGPTIWRGSRPQDEANARPA